MADGTAHRDGRLSARLGVLNSPGMAGVRDPSGTPLAQKCAGGGTEYYYLFDGQGNVAALEDPGQVHGSDDSCPTGKDADLGGGTSPLAVAALGNRLFLRVLHVDGPGAGRVGPRGASPKGKAAWATRGHAAGRHLRGYPHDRGQGG